jgi:CubicO group peptidase (beta-lactamase class C family)
MWQRVRLPADNPFTGRVRRLALSLAIGGLMLGGFNDPADAQMPGELTWPSKQFARPADLAVTYPCGGGSLCNIDDFMERQHVCVLVVMRGGELVLFRTLVRGDDDACKSAVERDRFGIASIAKSITALLFGFVYQDPWFGPPLDLGTPAADLIRAAGVRKYDGEGSVRDLLHMASGMEWSEEETDAVIKIQVDQNGELVGKHRRLKVAVAERLQTARFFTAGKFHYSGFDTQLIGITVESRLTPDKGFVRGTLDEALERFLWQPLPMAKNAEWNADFGGHPAAHCCLYASARDLAALGYWIMKQYKQGTGPQADWVRASMNDTIDAGWTCRFGGTERTLRYGYQWWVPSDDKRDGFAGIGTEGQYLHMFPEQDVVIAQFGEQLADDSDTCEALVVHRLIADKVGGN